MMSDKLPMSRKRIISEDGLIYEQLVPVGIINNLKLLQSELLKLSDIMLAYVPYA